MTKTTKDGVERATKAELLNRACVTAAQAKQARAFAPEMGQYFQQLANGWKRDYLKAK